MTAMQRETNRAAKPTDVGPEKRIRGTFSLRVSAKDATTRLAADHYAKLLRAWREQKAARVKSKLVQSGAGTSAFASAPAAPAPAKWIPIGPSVIRRGLQSAGNPAVSGRAVDLAIAPGGLIAYVATANGGVWRTDDGGHSWRPLMDPVDLNPTVLHTDSLACGAVAIDRGDPNRVYVGTGEGETSAIFKMVLGAVFSYAGIGPLRSDDGGTTWIREAVASTSLPLEGEAFFQLAVDPIDRELVLAATTQGVYGRKSVGAGVYQWVQRSATGICSSIVVSRTAGTTSWYAAFEDGKVLKSTDDGVTWQALGSGYPTTVTRISLAVQPDNPSVVYAFSSAGVHRLDVGIGTWKRVADGGLALGQSSYMMSITVDPSDVNRLYLGGVFMARAVVTSAGSGAAVTYSLSATVIGSDVHHDVHRLVIRPDAPDRLWAATDGGLFETTTASTTAKFQAWNTGLANVLCNYFDHHPTEAAVIFCGTQDNGTLRYTGEEAWLCSTGGDGCAIVINWADPYRALRAGPFGALQLTTDGGAGSWIDPTSGAVGESATDINGLWCPPLASAPFSLALADAEVLALGARRTKFSPDFGKTWPPSPDTNDLDGEVSAVVFANASLAYAGTVAGNVYRYRRIAGVWQAGTPLGPVGGVASAGLAPIVTDVIVDPADASGNSLYVCLGGLGDWRRIWHFDGGTWEPRSGPAVGAMTSVLNVHFNALEVDRANPTRLFAGADIGIWHSLDSGGTWSPYADGLPDAGVVDLKLHPTRRLLRAATYGRGMFERAIDANSALGVELYVRDTTLDLGQWPTSDGLDDPENKSGRVRHWAGPNIKVDPPSSAGTYQSLTTQIDFFEFVDKIVDGSDGVATADASAGTVTNRVYVEVHNRGLSPADNVRVMLLLTNASAGLPSLPPGYTADIQSGTPINTAAWKTIGMRTVNGLQVGNPQVVEFDLRSSMLPPPASLPGQSHYCLLALLGSPDDPFTNTQLGVDALSIAERKTAQRNIHIVEFIGTSTGSPSSSSLAPVWAAVDLHSAADASDLIFDLDRSAGSITVLLPRGLPDEPDDKWIVGGRRLELGQFDKPLHRYRDLLAKLLQQNRFDGTWTKLAADSLEDFIGGCAIRFEPPEKVGDAWPCKLRRLADTRLLLVFDPPTNAKAGDRWEVDLIAVDLKRHGVTGGCTYRCRVALAPDDECQIRVQYT